MAAAALDQTLAEKRVVMFSSSACPYCKKAKDLLTGLTNDDDIVIYDPAPEELRAEINKRHNHRTIPAVFIGGQFIGGNSEVQALHQAGKLEPLLQQQVVEQGPDVTKARPFWGMVLDSTRHVSAEWDEGPAWKAGIRPGQQVTHIDGVEMRDEKEIQDAEQKSKVGTPVSVTTCQGPRIICPMTTDSTYSKFSEFYTKTHQHEDTLQEHLK